MPAKMSTPSKSARKSGDKPRSSKKRTRSPGCSPGGKADDGRPADSGKLAKVSADDQPGSTQLRAVDFMRRVKDSPTIEAKIACANQLLAATDVLFPQKHVFLLRWALDSLIQSSKQRQRSGRSETAQDAEFWLLLAKVLRHQAASSPTQVHSDLGFAIATAVDSCGFEGASQLAEQTRRIRAVGDCLQALQRGFRPKPESLSAMLVSLHSAAARISEQSAGASDGSGGMLGESRDVIFQLLALVLNALVSSLRHSSNTKRNFNTVITLIGELLLVRQAVSRAANAAPEPRLSEMLANVDEIISLSMFHKAQITDYYLVLSGSAEPKEAAASKEGPTAKANASYQSHLFTALKELGSVEQLQNNRAKFTSLCDALPSIFQMFIDACTANHAKPVSSQNGPLPSPAPPPPPPPGRGPH